MLNVFVLRYAQQFNNVIVYILNLLYYNNQAYQDIQSSIFLYHIYMGNV